MRAEVTTRTDAVGAGPGADTPVSGGTGMQAGRRADMTAYARDKREALGSLSGAVLEIGAGCGANFGYLAAGMLAQVRRVLRPGGQFVFFEHVAAPRGTVSRGLQRCCAPLSRHLAAGCDPARETWRTIAAAGFRDVQFRWFSPRPAFGLYSSYLGGRAHA